MSAPIPIDEFLLDPRNECLWRGEQVIALRPKAYSLLAYLVEHPGRILTKDELLDAVWPDTIVGDSVLKVCIRELRQALGDSSTNSRFIETIHRRGYRWRSPDAPTSEPPGPEPVRSVETSKGFVGREAEIDALLNHFSLAQNGQRQLVLVSGEPGIGKTRVCAHFLEQLEPNDQLWVATGQCSEYFGTGEAYLPVLEALSSLASGPGAEELKRVLRTVAPTWLAQLPLLMSQEGEKRELERELFGATQGRMLREMNDALEALTQGRLLVLFIEDLHWADPSTVDLLGALARRSNRARLMILGTVRPVDLIVHNHPLRRVARDLETRGLVHELRLPRLTLENVERYVAENLGEARVPDGLAPWVFERTHGNPLFALNLLDSLRDRGQLVADKGGWSVSPDLEGEYVPEGVLPLIEDLIERRDPEEVLVLEAAAVAGGDFSSAAIAAIIQREQDEVEDCCAQLVRTSHFIIALGSEELPDGSMVERYRFAHAFYGSALLRRIPAARRRKYHARNAEQGIEVYGDEVDRIAAELADQFERAGHPQRAVAYLLSAAEACVKRFALREAEQYLERALTDCEGSGRALDTRLRVLERLGLLRRAGGDLLRAADAFSELAELASSSDRKAELVRASLHEASVSSWFDRDRCLEAIARAERASATLSDGLLAIHAKAAAGYWHLLWSERREEHAALGLEAREAAREAGSRELESFHAVRCAWFFWLGGQGQSAIVAAREGVALCVELGDWFDYLLGQFFLAWSLLHAGQWGELRRVLREASRMAERNGHDSWVALFRLLEAWLLMEGRDFEAALELALEAEAKAVELDNGFTVLFAKTITGLAHQGVGNDEAALAAFEFARNERSDGVLMAWVVQMVARSGYARWLLRAGQLEAAASESRELLEVAEAAGERTASAVARRTLAEVAHQQGDRHTARKEIEFALAHLEGEPAPLAAWRVHLTAAHIASSQEPEKEAHHRKRVRETARSLIQSMETGDELRASLESSPDLA